MNFCCVAHLYFSPFLSTLSIQPKIMNNMTRYFFMLCLLIIASSAKTFAQEPIHTDRPDQTECPFIVPKNYFQIENGLSFESTNDISNTYLYPSTLVKYGVNN